MEHYDVAIIGGGPAGSTVGSFLRKYGEDLKVLILERETFPRDHVGESQLPATSAILDEIGVWEKVEAADFPVKLGATYKWGRSGELWDFDFVPSSLLEIGERPGKFENHRTSLAFQVDRAVYDEILLDHAAELGCEVRQDTRVVKVHREGDRVTGLELDGGETVSARYIVDASGHAGIVRRAMDVPVEYPTNLQNIAIWDYWRDAEWAETIGKGGTRVQVISVRNGWVWFIPIGPDRTSVGLIVPAEYYKNQPLKPAELYAQALKEDARLAGLMANATAEGNLQTTKDWSFLSSRHSGENWFLVGEASGFADPILAAGMTISHFSGREAAFTILEADRGEDARWLREAYDARQSNRIRNHIRFADYWYSANAQFEDLREHTAEIARLNGLDLDPAKAWAWLAQGGFIEDGTAGTAGFPLPLIKDLNGFLGDFKAGNPVFRNNVFELDLEGATLGSRPAYVAGRVERADGYFRNGKVLPRRSPFEFWIDTLEKRPSVFDIDRAMQARLASIRNEARRSEVSAEMMPALEAMIEDGWVKASLDKSLPRFNHQARLATIHKH